MTRVLTGQFSDPGELGYRPSPTRTDVKSLLLALERQEQACFRAPRPRARRCAAPSTSSKPPWTAGAPTRNLPHKT
jgi:hypothetical protein